MGDTDNTAGLLDGALEKVSDLHKRLTNGNGLDAAFLGTNGVGKSTAINLLLLNLSVDDAGYQDARPVTYVPEGLQDFELVDKTYAALSAQADAPGGCDEVVDGLNKCAVEFLTPVPGGSFPDRDLEKAKATADQKSALTEASIKDYSRTGILPELTHYVLPCGDPSGSTTLLHTKVRYGSVVHLSVEYFTEEELQKKAFQFVELLRLYNVDNDPNELEPAWQVYLSIKAPKPYSTAALSDATDWDKLPSLDKIEKRWSDIAVGKEMLQIVSSKRRVYLGYGKSLHLDRLMAHDLVVRMNDKEGLYRFCVKRLVNYQPAAVLEGGISLVDLPGTNDADGGCTAETRAGVKAAGVVIMVLFKGLSADGGSLKLEQTSGLIERLAAGLADVAFVFNREPQTNFKHRELETKSEEDVRAKLEETTRDMWRKQLRNANSTNVKNGLTDKKDDIDTIAAKTAMRTIYPMLHTSFKRNWQFADENKASSGNPLMSGSDSTFELSNVEWLLGILDSLNRHDLITKLRLIAEETLPAVKEKLVGRLAEATGGGLSADIVSKASKLLKSQRSQDKGFGLQASELNKKVSNLVTGNLPTSRRNEMDALVDTFFDGDEVTEYLRQAKAASNTAWPLMKRKLRVNNLKTARKAIDPQNAGTCHGYSIMPVLFGHLSGGKACRIDFGGLVNDMHEILYAFNQDVVDLVINAVDGLIAGWVKDTPSDVLRVRVAQPPVPPPPLPPLPPQVSPGFTSCYF